jgi:uncharacterized protein
MGLGRDRRPRIHPACRRSDAQDNNATCVVKDGQIYIRTEEVYGNCRRYMQERLFLGPWPNPRGDETSAARGSILSARQQERISQTDTFFIATEHPEHGADVSHKGGKPGFVRIIDQRRIAFPDYNGNRMFNTLGNIIVNPKAGLLFIDFDDGRTLQLNGSASIDWNPERVRSFPGAERIVDFELAEVIDNPFGFPLQSKFRQFSHPLRRLHHLGEVGQYGSVNGVGLGQPGARR